MRWAWLLLVALGACKQPPPTVSTPDGAYRAFVEAIRARNTEKAYLALSSASRAAIEARTAAIADASVGLIKDAPAQFVFQSQVRAPPLEAAERLKVTVVEATDTVAMLEVTTKHGTERVKMVKDGEAWAVDLTALFARGATP